MTRSAGAGGGRRERGGAPRGNIVPVRLSDPEKAALGAAADRAGLALSAYMAKRALDAAELRAAPVGEVHRESLRELIRLAGLVRRAGVNLNQAVARLNATGEPGMDLAPAAEFCVRVVHEVDEAAKVVRRSLR